MFHSSPCKKSQFQWCFENPNLRVRLMHGNFNFLTFWRPKVGGATYTWVRLMIGNLRYAVSVLVTPHRRTGIHSEWANESPFKCIAFRLFNLGRVPNFNSSLVWKGLNFARPLRFQPHGLNTDLAEGSSLAPGAYSFLRYLPNTHKHNVRQQPKD